MKTPISLIALAACLEALFGCSRSVNHLGPTTPDQKEELPIYLLGTIDASDSEGADAKLANAGIVAQEVEKLHRRTDKVRVFVFDRQSREVASEVPKDEDVFEHNLADAVQQPAGKGPREPGTDQSAAVVAIADALDLVDTTRYRVRILISTDGGNEVSGEYDEHRYQDAVHRIAKKPSVEVSFAGVRPGLREQIRSHWKLLDAKGQLHVFQEEEAVTW